MPAVLHDAGCLMVGAAAGSCWEYCRRGGHGDTRAELRDARWALARRDARSQA